MRQRVHPLTCNNLHFQFIIPTTASQNSRFWLARQFGYLVHSCPQISISNSYKHQPLFQGGYQSQLNGHFISYSDTEQNVSFDEGHRPPSSQLLITVIAKLKESLVKATAIFYPKSAMKKLAQSFLFVCLTKIMGNKLELHLFSLFQPNHYKLHWN